MKYENPPEFTPKALIDLDSDNPDDICSGLLSICLNSGEYETSVNSVRKTISCNDQQVKSLAITCVGHIGRMWNKIPHDLSTAVERIWLNKSDPLWGYADDAIDDLQNFIKNYKKPG